jgi:hypothetical protein
MHRRIAAAALTAVLTLGLAGCFGIGGTPTSSAPAPAPTIGVDEEGDGGQTTADACMLIQDTFTEATDEFDQAATEDPAAVVEAMRRAATSLGEAAGQITNDEVAALLPSLQEMFTQVGDVMQAIVEGDVTQLENLATLGDTIAQTAQEFQELCGGS